MDLRAEARRSRKRLLPVTLVYSTYAAVVVASTFHAGAGGLRALVPFLLGVVGFTLIEYAAHRGILHGRFPDGLGSLARWAHQAFDHLHTEHHARPWDGNHINGTLKDTLLYVAFLAALSVVAPVPGAAAFWAGVIQAYVAEEWVHHAVHYRSLYGLRGDYWAYITRHHTYHHSPRGAEVAFGLTSGLWDVVFGTRIPEVDRRILYGGPGSRRD